MKDEGERGSQGVSSRVQYSRTDNSSCGRPEFTKSEWSSERTGREVAFENHDTDFLAFSNVPAFSLSGCVCWACCTLDVRYWMLRTLQSTRLNVEPRRAFPHCI